MRSLFFSLVFIVAISSCDQFFKIDETQHWLIVKNESDIDLEFQWSIDGTENTNSLVADDNNGRTYSIDFLTQDGEHDLLSAEEIYDHFDQLILKVETTDGSFQEIELSSLQLEPVIGGDGFMSTKEWTYGFHINNDHLN